MKNGTNVPHHLGIIVDGNRRWAKKHGLKPWEGHQAGKRRLEEVVHWCRELGVKELTIYSLSMQNFSRPQEEIEALFRLIGESVLDFIKDPAVKKYGIRLNVIGRTRLFPPFVRLAINKAVNFTRSHDQLIVNLALAYGGREEIVDAAKAIAKDVEKGILKSDEINEERVKEKLYLKSEPDLIIRTSGQHRTSNFLPWQSIYSEWFFSPKLFPDFTKNDLKKVMTDYKKRERRFGK